MTEVAFSLTKLYFDKEALLNTYYEWYTSWLEGDQTVEFTKWTRGKVENRSLSTVIENNVDRPKLKITSKIATSYKCIQDIIDQLPKDLLPHKPGFSFVRYKPNYVVPIHFDALRESVLVFQLSENPGPGLFYDDNKNVIHIQSYKEGYPALCNAKLLHNTITGNDERINFQLGVKLPWDETCSLLNHLR
jgi:hypothetical protein